MKELKDITVLLTGCGAPGAPGIIQCLRKVTERHVRIVGVDMNENAASRGLADAFHVVPAAKDDAFIPRVLEICRTEKVDVVEPIVTRELMKFSLAVPEFERLGVKVAVMKPDVLAIVNNKAALLSAMRDKGIPTADFRVAHTVEELKAACAELGYPHKAVCVKGAVGNGSRGVRMVDPFISKYDLFFNDKPNSMYISYDELIDTLSEKPEIPEMLVMEYLGGTEYTVDFLADRGKPKYAVCRRGLSVVTSNMMSLVITENPQVQELCERVVSAFGMDGNFGFDLLYDAGEKEPHVLEVNPRLTAGVVACAAAGVNLPYLGIKRLLGEELPACEIKYGTRMSRRLQESFFDPDDRPIAW